MKFLPIIMATSMLALIACSSNPSCDNCTHLNGPFNSDLTPFPKWAGVMEKVRMPPSKGTLSGEQALQALYQVHYGWWERGFTYQGYDPQDHWKTPSEFKRDKGGDCEDFAIADYFAGVELGIPEDDMELVIGRQESSGKVHAVLRLRVGERYEYFEGIGTTSTPEEKYLRGFTPYYGINRHHFQLVK